MQNYSSLLLLQSDGCETMSFLLVAISRSGLCYSFEAQHPSRPIAYPHMGVHIYIYIYIPVNITASEFLPPNNGLFYSLGATNLVHLTRAKNSVRYREIFQRDTIS